MILHLFVDFNWRMRMFIRSNIGENLVALLDVDHLDPSRWSSIARKIKHRGDKIEIFVRLTTINLEEVTAMECTSVYYNNRRPPTMEPCYPFQYETDTLLKYFNFTPVYVNYSPNEASQIIPSKTNLTYASYSKQVVTENIHLHIFYCNKNKKSISLPFLGWVQIGYDKSGWILISISYLLTTLYFYFYILKVKKIKKSPHSFSWLTSISLFFRQNHTPVSKKIVLLLAFCGWLLSLVYECFVKSEQTVPLHPQPYENFQQILDDGYKYFDDQTGGFEAYLVKELFTRHNITNTISQFIHKSDSAGDMFDTTNSDKLFYHVTQWHYNLFPYKIGIHCHILPDPIYSNYRYFLFKYRFQTQLQTSYAKIISSGINLHFETNWMQTMISLFRQAEKEKQTTYVPLVMSVEVRIYTVFVILLVLLSIGLIVFLCEICLYHRRRLTMAAKTVYFNLLSKLTHLYFIMLSKIRNILAYLYLFRLRRITRISFFLFI